MKRILLLALLLTACRQAPPAPEFSYVLIAPVMTTPATCTPTGCFIQDSVVK